MNDAGRSQYASFDSKGSDREMAKILLVDDDRNSLSSMRRVLMTSSEDHKVEEFTSPREALERARAHGFDVVISDYRMPEMNGAVFLEQFREIQPNCYRVVLTAFSDAVVLRNLIDKAQVHRFLEKPVDGHVLEAAVCEGANYMAMQRERDQLQAQVRTLESRVTRQQALLERVAQDAPGLLPEGWRNGA